MPEINGSHIAMTEGQRFYDKTVGERQPGAVGKVSFIRVCRRNGTGPLGISYVLNDGTGDADKPWDEIPDHLKLRNTHGETLFTF